MKHNLCGLFPGLNATTLYQKVLIFFIHDEQIKIVKADLKFYLSTVQMMCLFVNFEDHSIMQIHILA